jgi:hypothetical protein
MFFPSLTKPELIAIWTACLATPNNSTIHLYTDSQASIDSINKFRSSLADT